MKFGCDVNNIPTASSRVVQLVKDARPDGLVLRGGSTLRVVSDRIVASVRRRSPVWEALAGAVVINSPSGAAMQRTVGFGVRLGDACRRIAKGNRPGRARTHVVRASAAVAGVVLAASACSNTPSGAEASASAKDFFHGKTITYIVPNAPGTTPAQAIVALQPYMEKYLGATINIQYVSSNVIVGQTKIANSRPDGLTIGELSIATDLSQLYFGGDKVSFSLTDISPIGSTHQGQDLLVACSGSKLTSFDQLVKSPSQVTGIDLTSSPVSLWQRLLMAGWGVKPKLIGGYTSSTQKAGCLRGDADVTGGGVANFLSSAGDSISPGERPLLISGPLPSDSAAAFLNSTVPTLASYAKAHPPTSAAGKTAIELLEKNFDTSAPNMLTWGPSGIPEDRLNMLNAAMTYAAKQPKVQHAFVDLGLEAGIVQPPAVKAFIKQQLAAVPEVQRLVKG